MTLPRPHDLAVLIAVGTALTGLGFSGLGWNPVVGVWIGFLASYALVAALLFVVAWLEDATDGSEVETDSMTFKIELTEDDVVTAIKHYLAARGAIPKGMDVCDIEFLDTDNDSEPVSLEVVVSLEVGEPVADEV